MTPSEKLKKVVEYYEGQDGFRYGLKIVSPFADEYKKLVLYGAEFVEVLPGNTEIIENDCSRHRLIVAHVNENAVFEYVETAKGETSAKCDIYVFLRGRGAKAKISGRYDISGGVLDLYHKVYHEAPNTVSEIITRGVLRGGAHVIYRSDIVMEKGLTGLSGIQDGKFLTLSKEAKVDAIPSLNIASNAVNCSHSLSITNITPEDLFYAGTRGLGEKEAGELLVSGFLNI